MLPYISISVMEMFPCIFHFNKSAFVFSDQMFVVKIFSLIYRFKKDILSLEKHTSLQHLNCLNCKYGVIYAYIDYKYLLLSIKHTYLDRLEYLMVLWYMNFLHLVTESQRFELLDQIHKKYVNHGRLYRSYARYEQ